MRKDEDEHGGVLARARKIGIGDDIGGQCDVWEVLDVLVDVVDDVRQLLRLVVAGEVSRIFRNGDILFKYPHLDSLLEEIRILLDTLSNELGHGGSPVPISKIQNVRQPRSAELLRAAYQLPEPTTVTLCFRWALKVAMVLQASCLSGGVGMRELTWRGRVFVRGMCRGQALTQQVGECDARDGDLKKLSKASL